MTVLPERQSVGCRCESSIKFVHDDVVYCKYYEVVYILFHKGMRISEFCGLILKDIDFEGRTVNIDHQLQRACDTRYVIEETKTDAGKRKIPITENVAMMFQAITDDRELPKMEKVIDGHTGFLFYDDNDNPLVAMHWQHRFNRMVGRYNDIYWSVFLWKNNRCDDIILGKEVPKEMTELETVIHIPFEPYLKKIIEVTKCNPLEINYQLEIIKPLLEEILPEYQIPDTSNNSEPKEGVKNPKHNRYYYTLENGTAPDLLIAKNYRYENKNDKPDVFAAVEVKHQSSAEMFNRELIHEKPNKEYAIHLINEIATYMCVNNKVMATNCRRWQFFNKDNSKEFDETFMKEYLSIVYLLWPINSNEFKKRSNDYINKLWRVIEEKDQLADKCKTIIIKEKGVQWYAACVSALEKCVREMVYSCLCKTIDVLPNFGVITEARYSEVVEEDDFVKDLVGLCAQKMISTPKEWYELIEYIPKFVKNP